MFLLEPLVDWCIILVGVWLVIDMNQTPCTDVLGSATEEEDPENANGSNLGG